MRSNEHEKWVTIHLFCDARDANDVLRAQILDQLEAVGALLASLPDVGGTELRDTATPLELVTYVTPSGAAAVSAELRRLIGDLRGAAENGGCSIHMAQESHEGSDWREAWKRFYHPMVFGDATLLLRPSWIPRRAGDPSREVVLDPGHAFGTGQHESTRICIEALVQLACTGRAPRRVLDLGTGSGILGLCAAALFDEARVECLDNDPQACEFARANVAHNVLSQRVGVTLGQFEDAPGAPYDLMLANIRPEVLLPLAATLADQVTPQGCAVLSGILDEEHDALARAYERQGWEVEATTQLGEWRGLVMQRRSP
ncbi:MAG: 50S ribosomal protein L11 methyltransferase [Nannocystaceae bacterium]